MKYIYKISKNKNSVTKGRRKKEENQIQKVHEILARQFCYDILVKNSFGVSGQFLISEEKLENGNNILKIEKILIILYHFHSNSTGY
jgi:hypothetical protein